MRFKIVLFSDGFCVQGRVFLYQYTGRLHAWSLGKPSRWNVTWQFSLGFYLNWLQVLCLLLPSLKYIILIIKRWGRKKLIWVLKSQVSWFWWIWVALCSWSCIPLSADITHPSSKNRDITLLTKVYLVKDVVFPVVMYGCESWTIKKAEHQRIDAFELWCWRGL